MQNDVRPTIFFYNPNIYPVKEYLIRKNELDRYAQSLGIRVIDGDYRHDLWRLAVIGLEKRTRERTPLPRLLQAPPSRDSRMR